MDSFISNGDGTYPKVILDPENNRFEISGKSLPEDADTFYNELLDWLEAYRKNPNPETNFVIKLEAFNIASSKRILFLLYKLNDIAAAGNKVLVRWCYKEDDDDMYEVGMDFAFMVKIPFKFVSYQEEEQELALI